MVLLSYDPQLCDFPFGQDRYDNTEYHYERSVPEVINDRVSVTQDAEGIDEVRLSHAGKLTVLEHGEVRGLA